MKPVNNRAWFLVLPVGFLLAEKQLDQAEAIINLAEELAQKDDLLDKPAEEMNKLQLADLGSLSLSTKQH